MNNKNQKKTGLLLILPVLVFPFLAMGFWALGGGRKTQQDNTKTKNLNAELPAARPSGDSALDKMGFYDVAEKRQTLVGPDSVGIDSSVLHDLNLENKGLNNLTSNPYTDYPGREFSSNPIYGNASREEEQIQSQLRQLHQQLADQERGYNSSTKSASLEGMTEAQTPNQGLIQSAAGREDSIDPEMQQLETMMNRIYDIQHPDEVNNRIQVQSEANRGIVYPVETFTPPQEMHVLGKQDSKLSTTTDNEKDGFYGLEREPENRNKPDRGIEVIVHESQTVVNGASIRMRLLQDIYVNGLRIPKGNFISGTAQLSNDRLLVSSTTILYQQSILPVQLSAYDTDGMEGLYAPGSIRSEVLQQSGDNVLQSTGIGTLNPSLGAQAAAAGIETAKTLFSRKLKLVKVFIKAGHRIIFKNQISTNQNQ